MENKKMQSLLIDSSTSIKSAMLKLNETSEKILFVVNGGNKLMGTVTDGDIRRGIINGMLFTDTVDKIMQKEFISVNCLFHDVESRVKEIMLSNMIEQVPVVDDHNVIINVIRWLDLLGDHKIAKSKDLYPNHVVIMAGGKGTRLDPFTKVLPKPLVPIGNKPVIEIIMDKFYQSGFSNFVYTLNYKKEYIKLFLQDNKYKYNIDWVEERDYLGTAGSLGLLSNKVRDTFFLTNCDSILEDIDFEKVLEWHREHSASITIIGCHNEIKIPFGVLEMSGGRLEKISEKPIHDVIINTGVYIIEPHIISYLPKDKPMDMNHLLARVAKEEKVSVYTINSNSWLDIGQLEGYKRNLERLGELD